MTDKTEVRTLEDNFPKEEIGVERVSTLPAETNLAEVGVVDAPDGGRAAWTVLLGSFCVSKSK